MKIDNLSLSAIKYYIDAVEAKSLSRSAEKNYVSRPAVSQSIKRLEEWAGKKFLSHNKRLFLLTEEGQQFYRIAKLAYENFQSTLDKGINPNKSLSIGCSASLVDYFIIPTISKFKNVEHLGLKTGTTLQLRELLESNQINISISIASNSKNLNKQLSTIIHEGKFVLASLDGKMKEKIAVTEDRPEVLALKKSFRNNVEKKLVKIESWSIGLKITKALDIACFIPEIFLEKNFKPISQSFSYPYRVILEHRPIEQLSDIEIEFIKRIIK